MSLSFKQYLLELDPQGQSQTPTIYNASTFSDKNAPGVDNDQNNQHNSDNTDHNNEPNDVLDKQPEPAPKNEDPDKQGLIRRVNGAHLVYKRRAPDGSYEELWMYNIRKGIRDELDIRHAILAGTDVDPKTGLSQSGDQKYALWTNNNVQMLQVTGLPN